METAGIWVVCVLFILILVGVVLGVSLLGFRAAGRWNRFLASKQLKLNRAAARRHSIEVWMWTLLMLGIVIGVGYSRAARGPHRPAGAFRTPDQPLLLSGGIALAIIVAMVAYYGFRAYDGGIRRAQKRADAGDLDGAIANLREQIEDQGPTQGRLNALGLLLLRCECWDEAAALFRKAEELPGVMGVCRANLGLALLKGGKPEEALAVLQDVAHGLPQLPAVRCLIGLHSAEALAALGRLDEAREQFLGAEAAARVMDRSQRLAISKDIEQCRRKIAQGSQAAGQAESLENQ
jgi:tetratricopeptide (TPR) repeat protein